MILQLVNIVSGILLTSTIIKEKFSNKEVGDFLDKLHVYESEIGVGVFILGILGLVERLGFFYIGSIGASFPQSLPAIAAGLLLGAPMLKQFSFLDSASGTLTPYRTIVGIICIACGLGSLLFGCVSPAFCRAMY